jgi:Fic family protein
VTAPLARIRALVAETTTPRSRPEQEIAGYRDVVNTVHAHHSDIAFTPNVVRQFHRDLFRYTAAPGGDWKMTDNTITEQAGTGAPRIRFVPVSAVATPAAMDTLHERFSAEWQAQRIDRLLLTAAYVLDFLCIHPFRDGNGRMARLLALLLLYRAGCGVGRYISLERIVEDSKESYYATLLRSSAGWHEGQHALAPWTEYFLGVVTRAYREFESRVGAVGMRRGAKTAMVRDAVLRLPDRFRMTDLEALCPNVTRDMIRVVLNGLKKEGQIRAEGTGVGAVWRKGGNEP